jgi:hypothetical protein
VFEGHDRLFPRDVRFPRLDFERSSSDEERPEAADRFVVDVLVVSGGKEI